MEFMGYPRPDGSAGARNYIAVIPAVQCANEMADHSRLCLESMVFRERVPAKTTPVVRHTG